MALTACQPISSALGEDGTTTATHVSPTVRKIGQPAPPLVPVAPSGDDQGFRYKINYAALQPEWRALDDASHAYADVQKKIFLGDVAKRPPIKPSDGPGALAPWEFRLDFSVATETESFVSVLANGSVFTGGAHPAPLVASFSQHLPSNRIVTLSDLFTDASAGLKVLSDETRRQLKAQFDAKLRAQTTDSKLLAEQLKSEMDWIDKGTEPTAANFAVFLVDGVGGKAIGLTVIFPPYQVAPYVEGEPQVEVPARVFYTALKSEYRDAFAMDPEELKRLNSGQ